MTTQFDSSDQSDSSREKLSVRSMESLSIRYPQEQSRRSSALLRHVRHRSSSSSSLSVSACSISSTVSNYPPSSVQRLSYYGDQCYEDYEVFSFSIDFFLSLDNISDTKGAEQ